MIAIHERKGSFSDKWIEYCKKNDIRFKLVDCYDSEIIKNIADCKILLWHWSHEDYKAAIFARQLIHSLELKKIKVFPNLNTCIHFDDKIAQKYLFENFELPIPQTWVFYEKEKALDWLKTAKFPIVFKLKGGAGSENVKLIRKLPQAKHLVQRSFKRGFPMRSGWNQLLEYIWRFKRDFTFEALLGVLKGLVRYFYRYEQEKLSQTQKGYVLFQQFFPDCDCDIRVIIIGNKAFGLKRQVRKGDFRASGSGYIDYSMLQIPSECIKLAFEAAGKLKLQSAAFDFIQYNSKWFIVEVSYAFNHPTYYKCEGLWDQSLSYEKAAVIPEELIIKYMLLES